ncbi:uncharacterized protein LOC106176853 [Lingula anatina]|uniref:Uncharacterized protein LOC106176852 n=1 Tax=Lingula anatina TaxID=7574 RepID=A0A1S3JX16_LINAN|nr:uncharacterized protein LOC106176852 [Lingula anatina]XP_013414852.1 uncharacterized protein LOC106176853 [Lingula anatina]|eukprot:XP_013414851.1 uncharacterized protein LOC106176852 [Lingula anatina]
MDADTEKTQIVGAGKATSAGPLYHDSTQTPLMRGLQLTFVSLVVLMVLISIILSIAQSVQVPMNTGVYLLLGISLLGFAVIEVILIVFIRQGELPKERMWFLYVVGFCILLEAIFTDILLYQQGK